MERVARVRERRNGYKIFVEKTEAKKPFGITSTTLEDNKKE